MNNYGSRKFIVTLASLMSANVLLYLGLLTSSDYKAVILGTVAIYIAGNVTQRIKATTPGGA